MTDLERFTDFAKLMGFGVKTAFYNKERIVRYSDYERSSIDSRVETQGYDYIDFLAVFNTDGSAKHMFITSHVSLKNMDDLMKYEFIAAMSDEVTKRGYVNFARIRPMPESRAYVLNGEVTFDYETRMVHHGNVVIYSKGEWVELVTDNEA